MLRSLVPLSLVFLLGTCPPAAAQESIGTLRERLTAARAAHGEIPAGAYTSIAYTIDVAERIEERFPVASESWRMRAGRFLHATEQGRDPYLEQRGAITNRGYDSPASTILQGYGIYIPPDYDPSRRYPLLVILHGGSSNGNLFLGVVLGNNMDWLTYNQHLWDDYEPRWSPDWIIVTPDGFGQVLWRWMGEDDVLRVIDDVERHYSIDTDHVVLGGISNGGVGTYAIGTRHAYRFSVVTAMAGAPSWVQYTGGQPTADETTAMLMQSGMHLAENTLDTDFRMYHGTVDPGPMRPAYVHEMEEHMRGLGIEPQMTWYEMGHDILYVVHRHGRIYDVLAPITRDRRRADVRLVTGDYRASRQHWLTAERIVDFPRLAHVTGHAEDQLVTITTERVSQLAIDLRDAPVGTGELLAVVVDGQEAYRGPRASLGHVLHLRRDADGWHPGFLEQEPGTLAKVPGASGPITDAYRDAMIHVYGTQDPRVTDDLRRAAERGSHGWVQGLWNYHQRVVADTALTEEDVRDNHVVLYGTPGSNAVLERIADRLPIRVTADGVRVGDTTYDDRGVGVRFVYPSPLVPEGGAPRYVIVQAAPTADAVIAGNNLPDFVPDWIVYDAACTRTRPRLILGRSAPAMGFFDDAWQVRTSVSAARSGGDDGPLAEAEGVVLVQGGSDGGTAAEPPAAPDAGPAPESDEAARLAERNRILGVGPDYVLPPDVLAQTPPVTLPWFTPVPPVPRVPRHFAVPEDDPAGPIARLIARRIPTFPNYRGIIPGGEWRVRDDARWSVRPEADCLAALATAGITVAPLHDLDSPLARPLRVDSPIGGVEFVMTPEHAAEGVVVALSCEFIDRLQQLTTVLRAHHVARVEVLSAYRTAPRTSFHTMGLALDMASFTTDDGTVLSVERDFVETPTRRTCARRRPRAPAARELRDIACELADTSAFSSVLTPNYNDGHRNHFHVDCRPDDPRVFVR